MKTTSTLLALAAVVCSLSIPGQTARAQTTTFTYQGFLTDSGAPANGVYDLTFTLYDAVTSGSAVGASNVVSDLGVTNGLFTVPLNFGSAPFDGSDRWVQVAVRPGASSGAYTNVTPRQQITTAPYAIRALNATTFTGTISDTQLSTNVARLNSNEVFTGRVTFGNGSNNFAGTFSGNGAGVTNVEIGTLYAPGILTWGNFVSNSSPGAGAVPEAVVAADVNGDGKLDLISANYGGGSGNTLSVLTNNGSGAFVLASSPMVGAGPEGVVAADVNGDGKPDLISANSGGGFGNTLTVLTNNGSGGFVLASSPTVGDTPISVTAADVNGDGKLDLICANFNANKLTVLTNSGSGGFVLSSSPTVAFQPASVVAADVNGDGRVDLISANYNAGSGNTLTVLTNNGSGGFVLASSPGVGLGPSSVTAADVNGDGKVDLISADSSDNTLTVLTNNGSGGFVLASSPGVGNQPFSVTAADVNGDGKVDLISANYGTTTLTVLTNNGSGSFVLASSPGVGTQPHSVVAADVNGDGRVDLISANSGANTLTVLFNTPNFTGSFTGNGAGLTGLNATNVIGTLGTAQIPNLDASKITTGAFGTAQIPNLDASKITTGTFADARLSANVALRAGGNNFIGNQTLNSGSFTIGSSSTAERFVIDSGNAFIIGANTGPDPGTNGCLFFGGNSSTRDSALLRMTTGDLSFWRYNGVWSETMRILNSSGNVGIGTTSPVSPLEVLSSQAVGRFTTTNNANGAVIVLQNTITNLPQTVGAINFSDVYSPAEGQIAFITDTVNSTTYLRLNVSGSERMRINGYGSVGIGATNTGGAPLAIRGPAGAPPGAFANVDNPLALGSYATNNYKWIQSYGGALALNPVGNGVCIGQTNTTFAFEVNGSAHRADNSGSWNVTSDRRLKHDIASLTNSLATLEQLNPVRFRYNEDYVREHPATTDKERVGFVAQEFREVFPANVTEGADGFLSVDVSPVTIHNTAAIRELNAETKALRAENAELKQRLVALEKLMNRLTVAKEGGGR